jgi:predicted amidohydrolase YtcJ
VPWLLLSAALLGCNREPAAHPTAGLVFTGGRVHPLDEALPDVVSAMAVDGGRVVWVGEDAGAAPWIGPATLVVDLRGATVLPGFTDAHDHLLWSGADLLLVDLYSARTLDELGADVRAWADAHPDEPWVQGGGWSLQKFGDVLDRHVLDGLVPDRPAYLYSSDAHSAVANSRALALAGVDATTPDPPDGSVVRDLDGEPTGLLIEGGMSLVEAVLPPYSDALADQGLRDAQREANAFGLTNVVDPLVEDWMLAGYVRADERGELTVRVHGAGYVDALAADPVGPVVALRERFASERVEVDAGKVFLDGVIETQTALLVDPYVDGTNAAPVWDPRALEAALLALDDAGLQVHAHVIGDGAVRQLLDGLDAVVAARGERDRRPLAAHLELVHPDDLRRFRALGVLADAQALWAYPDVYVRELTAPIIGPARTDRLYPFGSLEDAGATLVGGSDWSVTSQNPWLAIEVMVRRSNPWKAEGDVLSADEAVSLDTAIRAYTSEGARASFSEAELGTLSPGKRADFVVLDRDPWAAPLEDLSEVRVDSTWLDGGRVYTRGDDGDLPAARGARRCPYPR